MSDHGGDGDGHGDYNNIHIRETIFIAEHPSLPFKLNHESNMADIAPFVLIFLGLRVRSLIVKQMASQFLNKDCIIPLS